MQKKIKVYILLLVALMFCTCSDGNDRYEQLNTPNIFSLNDAIGMNFPSDTRIISETDGGRIDAYYEWLFASEKKFKMPADGRQNSNLYLPVPINTGIRLIESRMGKDKINDTAKASFSSEWSYKGDTFRGTLVETPSINYLIVMQFKTQKNK